MSNTLKFGAAVLVLLIAGVIYVARMKSGETITSQTEYNTVLRCQSCGYTFKAQLDVDDELPRPCEKCGKSAAWRLKICRQCGTLFLPPVSGDPPRPPAVATCPKCGSQATGAAPLSAVTGQAGI